MLKEGISIPSSLTRMDLGCELPTQLTKSQEGTKEIDPIDYTSGLGMIFAGRPVQSSSSNYWLFEYIRRLVNNTDDEVMFESVVLGCTNKDRFQYAVYIYELGLEHRYLSEIGKLDEGKKLWLKVASVNPKMELLTFSLASRSGGIPNRRRHRQLRARKIVKSLLKLLDSCSDKELFYFYELLLFFSQVRHSLDFFFAFFDTNTSS